MTSTFRIGGDLEVRRLGFGAMHLPTGPGPDRENHPDGLLIITKVGVARTGPDGDWKLDGRSAILRGQVRQVLRRLRVERVGLLQLHRVGPGTPLAGRLGTLRELQGEGLVGRLGLSEVSVTELARAREIVDVVSVQNRYSLLDREHEPVLDACAAAGIAFLRRTPPRPGWS